MEKINNYFYIFETPFTVNIHILPENYQIERVELQSYL